MGDTGAMVIGMLLAICVIHFMSTNNSLPSTHPAKFTATVSAGVCFIIMPFSCLFVCLFLVCFFYVIFNNFCFFVTNLA